MQNVVNIFEKHSIEIDSEKHTYDSNGVLEIVRSDLEKNGYQVETSKKKEGKIHVPVLFGMNGKLDKYFEADGLNAEHKTVIEVEAGRGYANNQFLKDLFQASVMHNIDYLIIAVRNIYKTKSSKSKDFEKIMSFIDTLYASERLVLPLKGILILGY
tara:strand:+ start:121 stop:591 length:471 start_codon:yes stop_codon:yes gene_type:complete